MNLPLYSKAILLRPIGDYEAGRTVVITERLEPLKKGGKTGYAIEIGPWDEMGKPVDWTVVPESYLQLRPD
jgi:hypothetical protein